MSRTTIAAALSAVALVVVAPVTQAQSLPAGVRACYRETDSLKRLVCYDKEVAKYIDEPSAAPSPIGKPPPVSNRNPDPSPQASTAASTGAGRAPAPAGRQIVARVVSVENFPDAIVVHLDNGQIWQQIQEAAASGSLRAGDTVTIERQMAAYWLSTQGGFLVKVKQKIPPQE